MTRSEKEEEEDRMGQSSRLEHEKVEDEKEEGKLKQKLKQKRKGER